MSTKPIRARGASAWMVALSVISTFAAADCSKVESCRTGTLFLNIVLGAYTNVNELDVDVSAPDSGDGGAPHHTALTLTPGSRSGGVEVDFPSGYPTGKTVTVTLTLLSDGAQVAQRILTIPALPPSCTALSVDFSATDGGTDGSNGGVSGSAGAGGRGGTAGGGGGHAGTGGGGASGGTGGGCVPTGPENCFNNIDDDCDGKIDCADPDCSPEAQCVTADPTAAPIGVLTGVGGCSTAEAGYDTATGLMAEPNTLTCTGCSCKAPAVTCSTTLTSYDITGLCEAGSTVVEKAGTFTTGQDNNCAVIPPWSTNGSGDIFGISTTKFAATASGGCTPTGSAIVPTLTWSSNGTFCATSTVGGGCSAGQVCVPTLGTASACQLFDGAKSSCPGGATPLPWYTGSGGTASCGACTCGTATGASCDNVTLSVGSDYGCSGFGSIASGGFQCFTSGIYEPGVQFSGAPTPPSCPAQSAFSGSLAPTGPKTLCCP